MNKDVSNYNEEMVYNGKSEAFCASFWLEWWQIAGIQALKCLEQEYKSSALFLELCCFKN